MLGNRFLGVVVLICVSCAAPAQNTPKEEQKLTKKDERRGEEEPIVAPPPRYGNKVVKDERRHPEPETHAKDEGAECRIREAGTDDDEGGSQTECQPTRTFVQ